MPTYRIPACTPLTAACSDERQRLDQLRSDITRLAMANKRVQIDSAGQVVVKLKTFWRDDITHIATSPLEFLQRPAALAHGPRLHLRGRR